MNLVLSLVFIVSGASATVLVLPEDLIQVEGQNISVYCSVGPGETRLPFELFINNTEFSQTGKNVNQSRTANGTFFEYGPLIRSENGFVFLCDAGQKANSSILTVSCKCGSCVACVYVSGKVPRILLLQYVSYWNLV